MNPPARYASFTVKSGTRGADCVVCARAGTGRTRMPVTKSARRRRVGISPPVRRPCAVLVNAPAGSTSRSPKPNLLRVLEISEEHLLRLLAERRVLDHRVQLVIDRDPEWVEVGRPDPHPASVDHARF